MIFFRNVSRSYEKLIVPLSVDRDCNIISNTDSYVEVVKIVYYS